MSGLNLHTGEENQPQHNIADQLSEQARVRAEIEKQIETEQAQARTQQQQQARTSQYAASYTQTRGNTQQRHVPQNQTRKRAFGMDALALCAITLGIGTLFSPIMRPAPPVYAPSAASSQYSRIPMTPGLDASVGGVDNAGTNWNGSDIEVEYAANRPDGTQDVSGHFDWQANGQYAGREEFSGTYDPATHEMHVQGGDIQQVDMGGGTRLVDGDYNLQFGADGKSIVSGYMQGIPGGPSAVPGPLNGGL